MLDKCFDQISAYAINETAWLIKRSLFQERVDQVGTWPVSLSLDSKAHLPIQRPNLGIRSSANGKLWATHKNANTPYIIEHI